jgi:hypothetical protein
MAVCDISEFSPNFLHIKKRKMEVTVANRHLLNAIDYLNSRFPFSVIFKYDDLIDESVFRKHFEDLIRKFPQISGSFEKDDKYLYLNNISAVNIITKVIDNEPQLDGFTDAPSN